MYCKHHRKPGISDENSIRYELCVFSMLLELCSYFYNSLLPHFYPSNSYFSQSFTLLSLSLSLFSILYLPLAPISLSLSLFHFIFGLLFSGACFFNDNNYHALSSRQVVVKLDHLPCSTSQSAMILVLGKCFVKKSSFGCSKLKLAESSITYIRRLKFYNLFTVLYCRYLYYKYRY